VAAIAQKYSMCSDAGKLNTTSSVLSTRRVRRIVGHLRVQAKHCISAHPHNQRTASTTAIRQQTAAKHSCLSYLRGWGGVSLHHQCLGIGPAI
jgi:hypothetical protein